MAPSPPPSSFSSSSAWISQSGACPTDAARHGMACACVLAQGQPSPLSGRSSAATCTRWWRCFTLYPLGTHLCLTMLPAAAARVPRLCCPAAMTSLLRLWTSMIWTSQVRFAEGVGWGVSSIDRHQPMPHFNRPVARAAPFVQQVLMLALSSCACSSLPLPLNNLPTVSTVQA